MSLLQRNLRVLIALTATAVALAAPTAAKAFSEPDQISSRNGVLKTTFVAKVGDATIAGKRVSGAMTYNGKFPGPTLRVRPGDRIEIKFVNKLGESTNLHFHGLHVSPSGNADNILRRFRRDHTYKISVKIPHDHPNGLFWYHPHLHGVVNAQVLRGLAGMISVEGGSERVPKLEKFKARQIGLNLTQFSEDGTRVVNPNNQNDSTAVTTVNGRVGQTIKKRPGQTELWRIANMSNEGFYKLNLQGHKMWIVGQDGNPTRVADRVTNFVIPPGSRYEVLVEAGKAGSYKFQQLTHTDGFNTFPQQDLLTLNVGGATAASAKIPRKIKPFEDLSRAKVNVRRRWVLSFSGPNAPTFTADINGKVFDPSRVDTRARIGDVEEWTFVNGTTQDHPMHLHTNDFQVVKIDGKAVRPAAPIDNTILPRNGSVTIRFKPLTYTGLTVFHCHILFHEDSGMMATIRYVKGATAASVVQPAGTTSVHDKAVNAAVAFDPVTTGATQTPPPLEPVGHETHAARERHVRPQPGTLKGATANDWLFCRITV